MLAKKNEECISRPPNRTCTYFEPQFAGVITAPRRTLTVLNRILYTNHSTQRCVTKKHRRFGYDELSKDLGAAFSGA